MMLQLRVPVIVEGKYDKIRIVQVVDAPVITTDGFGIFNKAEKAALIRRLGQNGVILLCDSDGGGTIIRSFLKGILPPEKVYNLYIPQVVGKEKRKRRGGKAGFLGVEGIDNTTLASLFARLADRHPEILAVPKKDVVENLCPMVDNLRFPVEQTDLVKEPDLDVVENPASFGENGDLPTVVGSLPTTSENKSISKTDFYLYGLTGGENATLRRDALCDHLSLPTGMTPNALLAALNILYHRDEFLALCETLFGES